MNPKPYNEARHDYDDGYISGMQDVEWRLHRRVNGPLVHGAHIELNNSAFARGYSAGYLFAQTKLQSE